MDTLSWFIHLPAAGRLVGFQCLAVTSSEIVLLLKQSIELMVPQVPPALTVAACVCIADPPYPAPSRRAHGDPGGRWRRLGLVRTWVLRAPHCPGLTLAPGGSPCCSSGQWTFVRGLELARMT